MDRNDGGPAFPRELPNVEVPLDEVIDLIRRYEGMSLRDYFAGQALVGCFNFWVQVNARTTIGDPNRDAITKLAYEYADAMIKAREK